jgi:hypothetical protein
MCLEQLQCERSCLLYMSFLHELGYEVRDLYQQVQTLNIACLLLRYFECQTCTSEAGLPVSFGINTHLSTLFMVPNTNFKRQLSRTTRQRHCDSHI